MPETRPVSETKSARLLPRTAHVLLAALLCLPAVIGASPNLRDAEAGAPPLSWTHRDKVHKFSLKMMRDYQQVPLKTDEKTFLCKFSDPKGKGSARGTFDPEIAVLSVVSDGSDKPVTTGGGGGGDAPDEGPMTAEKFREMMERANRPKDIWEATLGRIRMTAASKKALPKIKKKFKKIKSKDKPAIPGKLWQFEVMVPSGWQGQPDIGLHVTLAEFTREGRSLVIFMNCGGKLGKAYAPRFKSIAKSFKWHDSKAKDVEQISDLEGVNITAKKRSEIERSMVKGWDAIVSPDKNYIVIYNTKNGKNHLLAKVIAKRIEALRAQVYEVQFPPAKPITTVCIVRVCKDRQEYFAYGGPGGSAGYWSPGDEELVFYDASASKKPDDDTLAVLYHEAFHQYIHYSVGRVAPHSWFNEGHGDYYAGAEYKGGKFKIKPFQWRVGTVKGAIVQGPRAFTEETDKDGNKRKRWENKGYTPLEDLVRFSQREYYAYPGVSYAQGWSLIYFLREIVPKNKKYNAKWGKILDVYFNTLQAEVNKDTSPDSADEGKDGDGSDDDGEGGGAPTDGDTPTPKGDDTPAPQDGDKPAPKGGDTPTPEGGDTPPGEGEEPAGPPPEIARVFFRGRGGPDALKKAVKAAFKDIDWDEFQDAWLQATKRGK